MGDEGFRIDWMAGPLRMDLSQSESREASLQGKKNRIVAFRDGSTNRGKTTLFSRVYVLLLQYPYADDECYVAGGWTVAVSVTKVTNIFSLIPKSQTIYCCQQLIHIYDAHGKLAFTWKLDGRFVR